MEYRAADNLPDLPAKRMFFNKENEFIKERLKYLNKYLKFIILIYEAIENPILQRFLEIDERYDPNNEFAQIENDKNSLQRSESDVSDTFLEMDKYMKERFKYVLKNKTGPNSNNNKVENIKLLQELNENVVKLKHEQK